MSLNFIVPTQIPVENKVYMMVTKALKPVTQAESFYEEGPAKKDPKDWPEASFVFDYIEVNPGVDHTNPMHCLMNAEVVQFEHPADKTIHELYRLSTKIARDSRRGLGNVILTNPFSVDPIFCSHKFRAYNIIVDTRITEGNYYMLYRGSADFDVPMVSYINSTTHNRHYVMNPRFRDMVKQFVLPK